MQPITIRFPTNLWAAVQDEARASGMNASEFARASCLAATVLSAVRRGAPGPAAYGELVDQAQRALRASEEP